MYKHWQLPDENLILSVRYQKSSEPFLFPWSFFLGPTNTLLEIRAKPVKAVGRGGWLDKEFPILCIQFTREKVKTITMNQLWISSQYKYQNAPCWSWWLLLESIYNWVNVVEFLASRVWSCSFFFWIFKIFGYDSCVMIILKVCSALWEYE